MIDRPSQVAPFADIEGKRASASSLPPGRTCHNAPSSASDRFRTENVLFAVRHTCHRARPMVDLAHGMSHHHEDK